MCDQKERRDKTVNDGNLCGFGFWIGGNWRKNDEVSEHAELCEAAPTSGLAGPMRISVPK